MVELGRFSRRWVYWAPSAAQVWSIAYGALAAYWLLGGRVGFPVANIAGDPPGGEATAIAVSALLLSGSVAGIVSARSSSRAGVVGPVDAEPRVHSLPRAFVAGIRVRLLGGLIGLGGAEFSRSRSATWPRTGGSR